MQISSHTTNIVGTKLPVNNFVHDKNELLISIAVRNQYDNSAHKMTSF